MEMFWMDFGFFGLCLLLLGVAVMAYLLGRQSGSLKERNRQARARWLNYESERYELKKSVRIHREMIEDLTEELKGYAQQSKDYEETQEELTYYRQEVERLERQLRLKPEEPSLESTFRNSSFDLINAMHEDPLHVNLTREDWEELFSGMDRLFPSFMSQLRVLKVTRHELEICCLIRLHFERAEMLQLFHCTSEALTKSRNRLKKRLALVEGQSLEDYLLHL